MKLTIRQWRRLKDITQGSLAEACGVTTATISNWERETKECRIPFAKTKIIAKTLGVSEDDIIFMCTDADNEEENDKA